MRIPTDLRRELRGYFQQLRQTSLLFEDERRLLARLSPELRSRVQRLANSGLIKKVPFFKNAGDRCIADILAGLEQQLYVPGEIVINEGDIGREMFFVKQGGAGDQRDAADQEHDGSGAQGRCTRKA